MKLFIELVSFIEVASRLKARQFDNIELIGGYCVRMMQSALDKWFCVN